MCNRKPTAGVAIAADDLAKSFFSLTPESVLDAVEQSGHRTTGLCYALNSLENRVYEVELDGGERRVGKFYRPGRWSKKAIGEEHALLAALAADEIPAVAPIPFPDGETLHATGAGILFTLFPRCGGRNPDELGDEDYRAIGRYLARVHNIAAKRGSEHRSHILPSTYGTEALGLILERGVIPSPLEQGYTSVVQQIVTIGEQLFAGVEKIPIHGDCHKGNLLRRPEGFFILDFDDMGIGVPVQDLWLLLPGRRDTSKEEIDAFIEGYEIFRSFDSSSLRLIEVLRALRYVRYAAWITCRWDDPSFPRAFPHFGSEQYWHGQIMDLHEQLELIQKSQTPVW